MKNINMIKVFMKENGIDFDKEFYLKSPRRLPPL